MRGMRTNKSRGRLARPVLLGGLPQSGARQSRVWRPAGALLVALAATAVAPAPGHSCCNVIPQVARGFRGARGKIDRPFARPGDWIEVKPECAAGLGAFDPTREGAYVVTILFATNGDRENTHVVVLASNCSDVPKSDCTDRA